MADPSTQPVGPYGDKTVASAVEIALALTNAFAETAGPALTADLAAAGDCPVSATIVASRLAATSPVTRRRFPVNIALRIYKSPVTNSLIVTENFPYLSP
jgi:hypothetical protein